MINRTKAISLAISQVGYKEKASNAFLDEPEQNAGSGNWTKYARDLDNIPGFYNGLKNGYDWCDIFVDWVFVRAYGAPIALVLLCQPVKSAGAGCEFSAMYYRNVGRFMTKPEVGDQIFFNYGSGISHTGIVVDLTQYAIITVEGNVDGQVKRCAYPYSANYIAGFGRPAWELYTEETEEEPAEEPKPTEKTISVSLPTIKYGDDSLWVKVMQTILIGKGFFCGQYGADGEYGQQTKIGLYEFQKANGLTTDGIYDCICDSDDWEKLLSV